MKKEDDGLNDSDDLGPKKLGLAKELGLTGYCE